MGRFGAMPVWRGAYNQQHTTAPQLHSMRLNRKCHARNGVHVYVVTGVYSYLNVNFRRQAGWENLPPVQLAYFFRRNRPPSSFTEGAPVCNR
jgi:hypothetical protein